MKVKKRFVKRGLEALAAVLLILTVAFYVWDTFGENHGISSGECEFHFIDVGQGDCSMFITEEGAIVVDAGTTAAAADTEKHIKSYTNKIDYLVLTHPHEDHIGGAAEIIRNIKVDTIILTDASSDTFTFSNLLDAMDKSGADIICARQGDTFSAGGMDMTVLAPLGEFDNFNNYSIVVRIDYGDTSALVTGDAEKASEKLMCKRWDNGELRADVLKLGHHGSSTSSSKEFVLSVDPMWAVISCGKDNIHGHPHGVTTELLEDYGIPYVRTDEAGSIVFVSDGRNIELLENGQ